MRFCDLQTDLLEDGMYRHICKRDGCGGVFVTPGPRHRAICRVQPVPVRVGPLDLSGKNIELTRTATKSRPSIARKASNVAVAQARWLAAGSPVRPEKRIAEIFAVCQECEHFRTGATIDQGSCGLCGCCLRRRGGLLNKIRMATEGCPAQPPKWEAEVDSGRL
jgi:hypothetical protein